jgi:hypothetical protein
VRGVNLAGSTDANTGSWWNFKTASCYSVNTVVSPLGSGIVENLTEPNCAGGKYTYNTVVQLRATAGAGYAFGSWSGSLTGTTNPSPLTVNGTKNVTANFIP